MATILTKTFSYQQPNAVSIALDEPDVSANVWRMTIKAKIGADYQRVGPQIDTIPPSLSGQGGARVIALASVPGVTEWEVTAETAANLQPGSIEVTAALELLNIPPPLVIVEGNPVPSPPLPVAGPANIAYVATPENGGNNATAAVGNLTKPYATFGAALAALALLPAAQRPGVLVAAGGTYLEEVFIQAGAELNGLVMIADGEVTIDSTTLGDALTVGAPSIAAAQAFQSFTMQGKWILRADGTQAINLQGLPDVAGGDHMGNPKVGGIQLRGVHVRDGNVNLAFASMLVFDDVTFANTSALAQVTNVSLLVLKNGTNFPNVQHSYNPTIDFDTLLPNLGIEVEAGCSVRNVEALGATKIAVAKGASMGAFDGTAWAAFLGVAPIYDEAPAIVMHGEASGNHDWIVPDEGAGAAVTVVDYEGGIYDGEMTGEKSAGVSRITPNLSMGSFSSVLDFTGLLDVELRKADYEPGNLSLAGGATADQSVQSVTANSAVGVQAVVWPFPYPAGVTDYTVSIQPNAVGGFAADPFISGISDTGFNVTATAAVSFTFTATRAGG